MILNEQDIATKAGLDEIFYGQYDREIQPEEVMATDDLFFRQDSTEFGVIQNAEFSGPGDFSEVEDDEDRPLGSIRIGNKQSVDVKDYEQDVPFPQAFLEDSEKYAVKQGAVEEMGVSARTTRDKFAFKRSWGNPFDAVNNPTPDGKAMAANDHLSLSGDTIDNLETTAFSSDGLKTLVRRLRLQKRQNGSLGSFHFDGLLVALNLLESAVEVTDSELKTGTANNNLNWTSNIYPNVRVGTSEYLHSDYNGLNANVDTTYAAICRRHKVTHSVRIPLGTEWIPAEYDRKRRAFYRARFRERVYPGTWQGFVISDGTV